MLYVFFYLLVYKYTNKYLEINQHTGEAFKVVPTNR